MAVEAVDSHARKRAIDELGKGMAPAVPGRFLAIDWVMLAEAGLDHALAVGAVRLVEHEHPTEQDARRPTERDARREAAVELLKTHVRRQRPDTDYDSDLEYLDEAILAFAEEWSGSHYAAKPGGCDA